MAVMRVARAQLNRAQYDERLNADLAGALQRLPGCQHVHLGIDRAGDRSIAVSVFDTMEHAQFSRDLLGDVVSRLQGLGVQLEAPEFYELTS